MPVLPSGSEKPGLDQRREMVPSNPSLSDPSALDALNVPLVPPIVLPVSGILAIGPVCVPVSVAMRATLSKLSVQAAGN